MTEEFEQQAPEEATAPATAAVAATGNRAVDDVLASLDQLDDAPVSEHVAVFESAHEQLRAALTDAGEPGA